MNRASTFHRHRPCTAAWITAGSALSVFLYFVRF